MTPHDRPHIFEKAYTEFLLRRVVHDMGNSISGINSLSDYHLRSGVNDAALTESLTLIRESAESSRELLLAVGTLLQPAEIEEEIVGVQALVDEAAKPLSLLLPRSVKLEVSDPGEPAILISVNRGAFVRKILALVALELVNVRIASGSFGLGWSREGSREVGIRFRSSIRTNSTLAQSAPDFLADLSTRVQVTGAVEAETRLVTMTFPMIELEQGAG